MRKNYLTMLIGCCLSIASNSYGIMSAEQDSKSEQCAAERHAEDQRTAAVLREWARREAEQREAERRASEERRFICNLTESRFYETPRFVSWKIAQAVETTLSGMPWQIGAFWESRVSPHQDHSAINRVSPFHQEHFWMVIGEAYAHSARFPGPNWIYVDPRRVYVSANPYHESVNDTFRQHLRISSYFSRIDLPQLYGRVSYIVDDIGGMGHLGSCNGQDELDCSMRCELWQARYFLDTGGILVTTPAVLAELSEEGALQQVMEWFEIRYRPQLKLDFAKPGLARDYYHEYIKHANRWMYYPTMWQRDYQRWQPPVKEDLVEMGEKEIQEFIKIGRGEVQCGHWLCRGDKIPSGDASTKPLVFFVKK